jgi:hypothetical protein
VTPTPPTTIRTSVDWLVARNSISRALAWEQNESAWARKLWPSSRSGRQLSHFLKADPEYGARVADALTLDPRETNGAR